LSEPDPRTARLDELREQVAAILPELRSLQRGTPEHEQALERYEPLLGAALALAEELEH
jgi:CHASE3 domain sensor protein